MQNQFVLSLLDQFGNSQATVEEDFENVTFTMKGENLCEDCLCVIYDISDQRYQKIKDFYRVSISVTFLVSISILFNDFYTSKF